MIANYGKAILQALHTDTGNKVVKSHEWNVVLDGRAPPINTSEKDLLRKEPSTLSQLRSGFVYSWALPRTDS